MLEDIARRLMAVVMSARGATYTTGERPAPSHTELLLPGHVLSTLDEADDYIAGQLALAGYDVERGGARPSLRRDFAKPPSAQYAPAPS